MVSENKLSDHFVESVRLKSKIRPADRSLRSRLVRLIARGLYFFTRALRAAGLEVALYPDHFGHQAHDVEHILRSSEKSRQRFVFLCAGGVPNKFLYEKHRQLVRIVPVTPRLWRGLRSAEKTCIRSLGESLFHTRGLLERMGDIQTWNNVAPRIRFSDADHRLGETILGAMGLERGKYVCVHARDDIYAKAYYHQSGIFSEAVSVVREKVKATEEGRFQRYRNSNFLDYRLATDLLDRYGLKAVRMGAKVADDLTQAVPNLVDFAARFREGFGADGEFADIYLMAHCRFCLGTSSAVTILAFIFNKPIVWVNSFPWPWAQVPPFEGSLYLPKLLRRENGSLWTFPEMVDLSRQHDWREMYEESFFSKHDLTPMENTGEDIRQVTLEMCERIEGRWIDTQDDDARQSALRDLFDSSVPPIGPARMGRDFLTSHNDLLSSCPAILDAGKLPSEIILRTQSKV